MFWNYILQTCFFKFSFPSSLCQSTSKLSSPRTSLEESYGLFNFIAGFNFCFFPAGFGDQWTASGSCNVHIWGLCCWCRKQQPHLHHCKSKLSSLWERLLKSHTNWKVLQWKTCCRLHGYFPGSQPLFTSFSF